MHECDRPIRAYVCILDEMVEIFEHRGLSHDDAVTVINIMSKYKDFFIDIMMVEELGLRVPDTKDYNVYTEGKLCEVIL